MSLRSMACEGSSQDATTKSLVNARFDDKVRAHQPDCGIPRDPAAKMNLVVNVSAIDIGARCIADVVFQCVIAFDLVKIVQNLSKLARKFNCESRGNVTPA